MVTGAVTLLELSNLKYLVVVLGRLRGLGGWMVWIGVSFLESLYVEYTGQVRPAQ